MDESKDFLTTLIDAIATALQPLTEAAATTEGLLEILDEIGVNPTEDLTPSEQDALRSAVELALVPLTNPSDVGAVISALPDLMSTFANELPGVLADVGLDLVDALIVNLLQREAPLAYAFLVFLGISELEPLAPSRTTGRRRSRWKIRWERIHKIVADPGELFKEVYGWGTEDFDPTSLLRNLRTVFLFAGLPAGFQNDDQDGIRGTTAVTHPVLRVPLIIHEDGSTMFEAGLALLPTRDDADVRFDGLALVPFGVVQLSTDVDLGEGWMFHSKGGVSAAGGFGLILRDQGRLDLALLDGSDGSDLAVDLSMGIEKSSPTGPVILFGGPTTSRLEARAIGADAQAEIRLSGEPEFRFEAHIHSGRLVISTAGSDSFLSKILPPDGIEAPFEVVIGWSNLRGVYFRGSAGLEITIPIHASLGPIELEALQLGVLLSGDPAMMEAHLGLDIGAEIGPIATSISRIGVRVDVSISRTPDFSLEFLPPTGAGLAIDAGGLIGGGFLEFDDDNKRYAGILALKFGEIGIVAIGLITTRMPDGSDGFSMLVNIGVTFDPPIQLSMGFTLSGVGGLIGINRTMMIDVLREGVKKRTLDSILFPEPEWVIPNAAKVISDLRSVFPPEEGRFVIGPMVKIGYGSPNIIVADIGIFLELFDPIRIVLLGQLAMELPDPEDPIVVIHLDVVGVLDFEKKELSFQASLYDSGILTYELFGDSAFFLSWGAMPAFAMSLGGFHPKFTPPPPPIVFDGLKRLGLNLSSGSDFQLSCGAYQALTPNSLQFGARVDLYAAAMGAEVTGFLAFDTLIYFSPFSFLIELGAAVNIRYKGASLADIRVYLALSGPTPWNARGTAVIKVLFFDVDVKFNFTWGREDAARLDPVDPWPELERTFMRAESWGSQLPPAASLVEALRSVEDEPVEVEQGEEPPPTPIVVHPAGTLEVRQNVAPLETTLAKFGNAPVDRYDRFRIEEVTTVDGSQLEIQSVNEFFARGQFEQLSNSQKLSIPSFEKMPGGVTTRSSDRIQLQGERRSQQLGYESILIQSNRTSTVPDAVDQDKAVLSWSHARFLSAGNAARRGALRAGGRARFAHQGMGLVGTNEEKYAVVNAQTLQTVELDARVDLPPGNMARSQADQALEQHLSLHPNQAGELAVIAEYEIEEEL